MAKTVARKLDAGLEPWLHPLAGSPADFDPLIESIGEAKYVLIGESTHGTHEFYRIRAEITKRLIREKGFKAVTIEGDWPDSDRVNRFVRGLSEDGDAEEALGGFKRFPTWMWRNADVLDFVGWLRAHNDTIPEQTRKVGFYGLDLYSLHASAEAVIAYLQNVDPSAAERARRRYACFELFGGDPQAYAFAVEYRSSRTCEDAVVAELVELLRNRPKYEALDGAVAMEDLFSAEQNAFLVKNAEIYYRNMLRHDVSSWNLRDGHMMDTFDRLARRFSQTGQDKIVVWAHNSHVGDAGATSMMAERHEINIGHLVRSRYGEAAYLIGFTTASGTVTAASSWGATPERKRLRPPIAGSYESMFHETGIPRFLGILRGQPELKKRLSETHLERAVGVLYLPETERFSHYFDASLGRQFDAIIHHDVTRAVEPLEKTAEWLGGEVPETYPSGI